MMLYFIIITLIKLPAITAQDMQNIWPMRCQITQSGKLFKLSELETCKKVATRQYLMKVEKMNIKQESSDAESLQLIKRTCKTGYSFWGVKTMEKSHTSVTISKAAAENLINRKVCQDISGEIHAGKLEKTYNCVYRWMASTTTSTISCYFNKGTVTIDQHGLVSSSLGSVTNCIYKDEYCETAGKIHMTWKAYPDFIKKFIIVGTYNGSLIQSHLIIGKLGLSFRLDQYDEITGNESVVYDKHGFKLTKLKTWQQEKVVKPQTELLSAPTSVEERFSALQDEVNARLQYLTTLIESPLKQINSLCQSLKMSTELNKKAAIANPTAYVRAVLNNNYLTAVASTDFLKAWPCHPVEEWSFIKPEECFKWPPITYRDLKHTINKRGFLEPETAIIHDFSAKVDCRLKTFGILQINGKLYTYTPKQLPKAVPNNTVLELPLIHSENFTVDLTLPENWVYNQSDFTHVSSENALIDNFEQRIQSLEDEADETVTERTQKDIGRLFGFADFSVAGLFDGFINTLTRIGALMGAIALGIYLLENRKTGGRNIAVRYVPTMTVQEPVRLVGDQ